MLYFTCKKQELGYNKLCPALCVIFALCVNHRKEKGTMSALICQASTASEQEVRENIFRWKTKNEG